MLPGRNVAVPYPSVVDQLAGLLMKHRVDLVHAHGTFSTLAIASLAAADQRKVPSVLTSHSIYRGSLALPLSRALFAARVVRADMLTAVSEAAAADLRWASGNRPVHILPNGIDPRIWQQRREHNQNRRIVSVMRLHPKKSGADLVRVAKLLTRQLPASYTFELILVGDGPARPALERLARQLGVANCITFTGERSQPEVARLLAASSIFVLPSRCEAFGLSVLEARATGLPVVAFDSGGIRELIRHGQEGFLAKSLDQFVSYIAFLLQDNASRETMGSTAQTGLECFGWDHVVARHIAIYGNAIGCRNAPFGRRSWPC
jgi:glycosyltransferase involved in cell wall biosynthesis